MFPSACDATAKEGRSHPRRCGPRQGGARWTRGRRRSCDRKTRRRNAMPRGSCDPSPHAEACGDHRRLALSTRGSSCCQGSKRATSSRPGGTCPVLSRQARRGQSPKREVAERAPESARTGRDRPPKRNHLRPDSVVLVPKDFGGPKALRPGRNPGARPSTEVPEDAVSRRTGSRRLQAGGEPSKGRAFLVAEATWPPTVLDESRTGPLPKRGCLHRDEVPKHS
jgi:hypothetical protein